MFSNISRTR